MTDASGTNQPTGSEPSTQGDSNDGVVAAIVRIEGFIKAAIDRLFTLGHPAAAAATVDLTNALHHAAEGKAMAVGEAPSGAVAAAGLQVEAPAEAASTTDQPAEASAVASTTGEQAAT